VDREQAEEAEISISPLLSLFAPVQKSFPIFSTVNSRAGEEKAES
jgi:hypothetical protein